MGHDTVTEPTFISHLEAYLWYLCGLATARGALDHCDRVPVNGIANERSCSSGGQISTCFLQPKRPVGKPVTRERRYLPEARRNQILSGSFERRQRTETHSARQICRRQREVRTEVICHGLCRRCIYARSFRSPLHKCDQKQSCCITTGLLLCRTYPCMTYPCMTYPNGDEN